MPKECWSRHHEVVSTRAGTDRPSSTDPSPEAGRRLGRPRDEGARAAILTATMDVLGEVGFGRLTIDAVAARAGVGKATIYRRWDSKERLTLDAISNAKRVDGPVPDTGSLREDLIEVYQGMLDRVGDPANSAVVAGLMAEAALNRELAAALADYISDRRERTRTVVRRGIERGELPAGTDVDLLMDLVGGPMLSRALLTMAPVDQELLTTLVDVVIGGLGNLNSSGGVGPT
jgi:AcrR family transcriptional regulator